MGFVLTLLCTHLSSFVGRSYIGMPGPSVPHWPIPGLVSIPVIGPVLFDHNALVYLSYVLVIGTWFWISHTRMGLTLRAIGERPEAAHSRGYDVNRLRYLYTAVGGALVGLAGAAYSLDVKLGWSHRHTAGMGWIALAIVIFGGWHPFRVAFGAVLFGALKSLGTFLQPIYPSVPSQVFQAAPFALMILALLLVSDPVQERLSRYLPPRAWRAVSGILSGRAPAALGRRFQKS